MDWKENIINNADCSDSYSSMLSDMLKEAHILSKHENENSLIMILSAIIPKRK